MAKKEKKSGWGSAFKQVFGEALGSCVQTTGEFADTLTGAVGSKHGQDISKYISKEMQRQIKRQTQGR